jgi:hypothetical protein
VLAQIGLGDPTGGILVLLVVALLTVAGLVISIFGAVSLFRRGTSRYRSVATLLIGLVLMSPALWFAYQVFEEDLPRDKSWDFSSSRSVVQLGEEKQQEYYYYQGNLRSTVKLPSNKQWSGTAYLVRFKASAGQITEIHWQSKADPASQAYRRAKMILAGLALPERDLDAWYDKVSRGEQASFTHVARSDAETIEVQVRGSVKEADWVVHVNAWWK